MTLKIKTITLPMPLRMGMVNSYLIETSLGHLLIDTAGSTARAQLLAVMESSGCTPDSLKLVILTHGDFDHIGNAAHLRSIFKARLAMHRDDSAMAEQGDMFANRKKPNVLVKALIPMLSGFGRTDRFIPDILLSDGDGLSAYGLEAKVISLPGHSKGSIGILTGNGEFFCGDLFENMKGPTLNSLMDDPAAAKISIDRLIGMKITTVYPGHGQPFTMESLKISLARQPDTGSTC